MLIRSKGSTGEAKSQDLKACQVLSKPKSSTGGVKSQGTGSAFHWTPGTRAAPSPGLQKNELRILCSRAGAAALSGHHLAPSCRRSKFFPATRDVALASGPPEWELRLLLVPIITRCASATKLTAVFKAECTRAALTKPCT